MPTLYVLSGPELGKSFSVRHGDTLGRGPDRIVTLRHPSVSRRHAHFEQQEGVWYLVDDGSQNGISFEGQRTERAALSDAAEFALGEILLRFRLDAAEPSAASAPAEPADEEIFLEGDDEPAPVPLARTVVAPAPVARAPGSAERRPAPPPASGGRRVLQYHRIEGRDGLASAELAQLPGWARALLVLLALALAGGIAYLAFRGTSFVKEQVRGGAVQAS